ncbi:hypothetical protein DY000_02036361 [Brassica cretica]|uniref:Uncharacterized protein n=1 Tax=Brassica cretica TaxID=69181 RepID=A0ABQ7BG67_BRACR|nr:hypothetical protein DY000_02036361 [Brassica cretica]
MLRDIKTNNNLQPAIDHRSHIAGRAIEQIEAISQLSPANAEHTMEMQVDQQHTNVSQDAPNVKNTKQSASKIRTAIASTEKAPTPAKGYLKKHISRSPDIKGVMASKKLHYRRGRASPKKKAPVGKSSMAQNITLPRFERRHSPRLE